MTRRQAPGQAGSAGGSQLARLPPPSVAIGLPVLGHHRVARIAAEQTIKLGALELAEKHRRLIGVLVAVALVLAVAGALVARMGYVWTPVGVGNPDLRPAAS